jgi:hypothetical protein
MIQLIFISKAHHPFNIPVTKDVYADTATKERTDENEVDSCSSYQSVTCFDVNKMEIG